MENIRRRHNYLPIIMEMLKLLAQRGQLNAVYEKAKEKTVQMNQAKAAKRAKWRHRSESPDEFVF